MEWTYQITPEDFIAFNRNFMCTNRMARHRLMRSRLVGAVMILAIGLLFGAMSNRLTLLWAIPFVAFALLYFFLMPRYLSRSMNGKIRKMLKNGASSACGAKQFTLGETQMRLTGEKEDTSYEYADVQQVITDDTHYYIYVGAMEALILPYTAFATVEAREQFYQTLCSRIQEHGGRIAPEKESLRDLLSGSRQ